MTPLSATNAAMAPSATIAWTMSALARVANPEHVRKSKMSKPLIDPDEGICAECGEQVVGFWRDFGIGTYEHFGTKGVDEDWRCVSHCCEAEIIEPEDEDNLNI